MSHAYVPRENEGGNFCGHDRNHPRFTLVKCAVGNLPNILQELMKRLRDFYWKPDKIPSLKNKNRDRSIRSERRESCLLMLSALLKYCDLASLRCGHPTDDGFVGVRVTRLAEDAGLTLRRAERAIDDLKVAGILTVFELFKENPDGSISAIPAVKALSKHLFQAFGMMEWLARERDKASERIRRHLKRFKKITLREKGRAGLVAHAVKNRLGFNQAKPKSTNFDQAKAEALRQIEALTKPDRQNRD